MIPPVSFCAVLYIESGTPIVCFCTSMAFFPQELVVTSTFPFSFKDRKAKVCEDAEKADTGRCVCLDLCGRASPRVGARWWERSFPDCSPKFLVPDKLRVYLTKLHPMVMEISS